MSNNDFIEEIISELNLDRFLFQVESSRLDEYFRNACLTILNNEYSRVFHLNNNKYVKDYYYVKNNKEKWISIVLVLKKASMQQYKEIIEKVLSNLNFGLPLESIESLPYIGYQLCMKNLTFFQLYADSTDSKSLKMDIIIEHMDE